MKRLCVPFFVWVLVSTSGIASSIVVSDPYAKATHGVNGAAFMTLTNPTKKSIKLIRVKTDPSLCSHLELHTHIQEGDVYKMRRIQEIVIHPESTIVLKPGGLHIMFMNLTGPLKEGTNLSLTLEFEREDPQVLTVPVRKIRTCGCHKKQKVSSDER